MSSEKVLVNIFPGAANLPLHAALAQRTFERNGLQVEVVPTRNSREQMQGLIDGAWQIAHTSPDNVFAWAARTGVSLIAVMGGYAGALSLYAQPEITSLADLRGRAIGVDAPDTGFVFVLHAMLEQAGLGPDDYSLDPIGGTNFRLEALKEGRTPATLLNSPFDLAADRLGFRRLRSHPEVFAHYSTGVGAVRRDWAEAHSDVLVRYIRGFFGGLSWATDAAHREEAIAFLESEFHLEPEVARTVHARTADPVSGFPPAARLDLEGMQTVLSLRARFAHWAEVPPLERFYDLAYYQRALSAQAD